MTSTAQYSLRALIIAMALVALVLAFARSALGELLFPYLAAAAIISPLLTGSAAFVLRRVGRHAVQLVYLGCLLLTLTVVASPLFYRDLLLTAALVFLVWMPQVLCLALLEWQFGEWSIHSR